MHRHPINPDAIDNGGRRRVRDRRVLISGPPGVERRTHWERRNGLDRRIRRVPGHAVAADYD
ncbi:hypothetical protein DESC_150049 [Desulfosarcina cetonica]|uniref:hypothetical protein n=1 Tax=Desulfosarcina cetonica TaxID=90730 RepID=UPI0006D24645|nr:hypothetical protein [Desulfosarcina cetonica]VTR64235.1 hypothetical protein DESC_150049 [Desulfosarcina cetonica]